MVPKNVHRVSTTRAGFVCKGFFKDGDPEEPAEKESEFARGTSIAQGG
jgi:hypothetical protein